MSASTARPRLDLAWRQLATSSEPHATLVALPSLGTTTRVWEPVARSLGTGWDVLGVDLPGHGSAHPRDVPLEVRELATAVAPSLLAWVRTRRLVLAGVSLGGAMALELAGEVDAVGVLIVNSGLRFGDSAGWDRLRAAVRVGGTAALAEESAVGWFSEEFRSAHPELVACYLDDLAAIDDRSYLRCCDALEAYDGRAAAARAIPPLIAVGTSDDPATPASGMRELAAAVVGARYLELEAGRHLANVENPERIAALITELGAADECS